MTRKAIYFIQIVLLSTVASCRVYRPPVTPAVNNGSAADYINSYKDLAVSEMKRTGIPASITLAQGMLESDYGRSNLARMGNNHFGIKCHNDWNGPTILKHDDRRNDCFRKYQKSEDSFYDHSDFLRSGSRYNFLFSLDPTDYKAWAHGLKKAGYATNPDYAYLLIRKIEENNLYNFDRGYMATVANPQVAAPVREEKAITRMDSIEPPPPAQSGNSSFGAVMARVPRVMENNRIQYIIVKDGDTREKLETEFQLLKWELAKYNELDEDFILVPGQVLYLQPKREKAEAGKEFHNVENGETMYMISQKYGIKLRSVLEMNRMEEGTEPIQGQKIWLRGLKPVN